jgi:NitT/TauT family transport system permease protein
MARHEPPGRVFGSMTAALRRASSFDWIDLAIGIGIAGLIAGGASLAHEWVGAYRPSVEIDLSLRALPRYTLLSLGRGLVAYALSLGFTLVYGYWAARDRVAERVLVPLLDVLQSIPVLGFMPGLVLALVALSPRSNLGLELAAVLMIFTGQVWNMTFSFYHSLRSIPPELSEVGRVYRFDAWQRLRWIGLPSAVFGLVWNSMMSMAGGWFFLMISEAFVLGDRDFRLPGLGSYMSVAVARGDAGAMTAAVVAMVLMIVALDRILWRPVAVWAQRFRMEEGGGLPVERSRVLDLLRRSRLPVWLRRLRPRISLRGAGRAARAAGWGDGRAGRLANGLARVLVLALLAALVAGALRLASLISGVALAQWTAIALETLATLARVLTAVAVGTLWTVPAGLAIGLSPRVAGRLQPVAQVVASFPAPMLFPLVVAGLHAAGVSLGVGSILLMLLGTQWYILFNVIAGAAAIPADLCEVARSFRMPIWARFRGLYAPAIFPYLVTGWVTAAGGAWNASIVSEYVSLRGEVLSTAGIGAAISQAAARADFPGLAASVIAMAATVVVFNRFVWRRCYRLAEERFSLAK